MKCFISLCFAALMLLGGCATVIRSDVTAFNEWPADLTNKSYVFERTAAQENDLEYKSYENLVGAELQRLGFALPTSTGTAQLKVALKYEITTRDVFATEQVVADPLWYGPYGPYEWRRPGFYNPFYEPLWYRPQVVGQHTFNYQLFQRRLNVTITRAINGKKLYDVTVTSESKINSIPTVMPYLLRSAFIDLSGKSRVPHTVKLKVEEKQ